MKLNRIRGDVYRLEQHNMAEFEPPDEDIHGSAPEEYTSSDRRDFVPVTAPLFLPRPDHLSAGWSGSDASYSSATSSATSSAILKLLPDEVSVELFNSQYLQHHSSRADAILAVAKVSRTLGASREEVEASLFNALNADVELKLEVSRSCACPSPMRHANPSTTFT